MPWKRSSQEVDCPWSQRKEILRVEVLKVKDRTPVSEKRRDIPWSPVSRKEKCSGLRRRLLRKIFSLLVKIHMIEGRHSTCSGKRRSDHFRRMESVARRCSWGCPGCRIHGCICVCVRGCGSVGGGWPRKVRHGWFAFDIGHDFWKYKEDVEIIPENGHEKDNILYDLQAIDSNSTRSSTNLGIGSLESITQVTT